MICRRCGVDARDHVNFSKCPFQDGFYAPPKKPSTDVCNTCGCVVCEDMTQVHHAWHLSLEDK